MDTSAEYPKGRLFKPTPCFYCKKTALYPRKPRMELEEEGKLWHHCYNCNRYMQLEQPE